MLMSKDYARELNANIIIFIKQAQMINSLYSSGYAGAANPCLVPSRQPGKDPDLHPDLHPDLSPKPGRQRGVLRQVEAGWWPAVELGRGGGRGWLPFLWSAAVLPGGPGSDMEAVDEPRWSGKPGAEKKWGSLAGRFR